MRPSILRAVVLVAAGCHHPSTATTDAAIAADAAIAPDLGSTPDLATSTVGIACGTTPCAANAQFCCTEDSGQTGMCGFGNDAASCAGVLFYCDGPEDCPPAEPYCCVASGAAVCGTSMCPGNATGGYEMCHTDHDCATGYHCCGETTTPYRLCLTSCQM